MDWVFTKEAVIVLALLGAVPSLAASFLRSRLGEEKVSKLNTAGYGFMGASMLLFIIIGFRA